MLIVQPVESMGQRIREEFRRVSGLSANAFAQHCIDAGLWTDDELEAIQLRGVAQIVKRELRARDKQRLPFAGQTTETDDDGAPIWKQRRFWDLDTYLLNISNLETKASTMFEEASALRDEVVDRFGVHALAGRAS